MLKLSDYSRDLLVRMQERILEALSLLDSVDSSFYDLLDDEDDTDKAIDFRDDAWADLRETYDTLNDLHTRMMIVLGELPSDCFPELDDFNEVDYD